VHELIVEAIHEVRRVSSDLSPAGLHDFGLHAAVNSLVARLQTTLESCNIVFNSGIAEFRFKPNIEIGIYRIIQEALNNAIRHSNATQIEVNIFHSAGTLFGSVMDNGAGIPQEVIVSSAFAVPRGKGLNNMKERAHIIGGKLHIVTEPASGVLISFEVKTNKQNK
jgi:signal transduction histidine kinase